MAAGGDAVEELVSHVVSSVAPGDVPGTLEEFLTYSERKRMGMHLGQEKGTLIEVAVREGLPSSGPAVVLEMGCHAGDGTLFAASVLRERPGSTIVSTEANLQWLSSAERVVRHATSAFDLNFVPLVVDEVPDIGRFLDLLAERGISQFHSVILDQDPGLCASHVRQMLARGFLRPGAVLYVDNARTKRKKMEEYLRMVKSSSGWGFDTRIEEVHTPYQDAVAISKVLGAMEL